MSNKLIITQGKGAVPNSGYKFDGDFRQGTSPTLLDSKQAQRIKAFIENLVFRSMFEIQTGSPSLNSFQVDFSNNQSVWFRLALQTALQFDENPTLGGNLHLDNKYLISDQPGFKFVQYAASGFGVHPQSWPSDTLDAFGASSLLYGWYDSTPYHVGFRCPSSASLAGSGSLDAKGGIVWVLPAADGSTGQVLSTDGSRALSWITASGSGTVTSVATSSGTFVAVSGGTITSTGTITADLSATGTADATTFLRGDNTWVTPSGSGTVTSVATSNGTFINVTGGTITATGTITGDLSATGTASATTFLRGDNTWASAYSWTVADQHGNDQEVGDGGIVTIFGDDFIDCTLTTGSDPYWALTLDATGTAGATTFLRGDNTWSEPVGTFDFDVQGDAGGPTTVGTGNIIGVAGGYGPIITRLLTVVNGTTTQQFLIDHEESADPAIGGAYTNADITIDDFGHVTVAANGSTSGYEFDLDGDSGPTQTVESGDTVTLSGGNGLDTVASATDTVTFAIDDSIAQKVALTADGGTASGDATVNIDNHSTANAVGLVAGDNVTLTGSNSAGTIKIESAAGGGTVTSVATANGTFVDVTGGTITATGTITGDLSATGTAGATTFLRGDNTWSVPASSGMTSFDLDGDSGSTQTVEDGNTVTLAGGTGLSSVASATDTITTSLDDTAVTPGSYTSTDLTVDAQGRITAASDGSAGGCGTLPESDHPYAADTDESWEYECCCSASIDVTFNSLTEVEDGSDYIHIHYWDGDSWEHISGSPFTGTELASATKTVTGSKVKISLVADGSVQEYGFKVTSIASHQPGIISFDLAGDSGPTQTLDDGDTITLAGGNGLESVASADDTVTFAIDGTPIQTLVLSGNYTGDETIIINENILYLVGGPNVTLHGASGATVTFAIDLTEDVYWEAKTDTVNYGYPLIHNTSSLWFKGGSGITTSADDTDDDFITISVDHSVPQRAKISASGGTQAGDSTVTFGNLGTGSNGNTISLIAGSNITITGNDAAGYASIKIEASPGNLTTKGDLEVYGTSQTRFAVGTDGQSLIADSSMDFGLTWGTPLLFELQADSSTGYDVVGGDIVKLLGGNGLDSVTTYDTVTHRLTFAIDETIAQEFSIEADGGSTSGDSVIEIENSINARRPRFLAGENITLIGDDSTCTIKIVGMDQAPIDAKYVVLTADGDLTDERVLTAGTGISLTDGGAGSTITIAATGGGGGGNLTTKGDLEVYTTSQTRLGVGDNDEVLIADSTAAAGVKWGAAAAGGGGGGTDLIVTEITSGTSLTVTDVAQDTIFQLNIPALDDTFMLTLPTAAAAGAGRRFHFMVTFDNEDWYEFQLNTAGSDKIFDTYFQNQDWSSPDLGGHTTAANYIPYSTYTIMSDGDNWISNSENSGGYWYYND